MNYFGTSPEVTIIPKRPTPPWLMTRKAEPSRNPDPSWSNAPAWAKLAGAPARKNRMSNTLAKRSTPPTRGYTIESLMAYGALMKSEAAIDSQLETTDSNGLIFIKPSDRDLKILWGAGITPGLRAAVIALRSDCMNATTPSQKRVGAGWLRGAINEINRMHDLGVIDDATAAALLRLLPKPKPITGD